MPNLLNEQWQLGEDSNPLVFGVDVPLGHEANVAPGGRNWRVQDVNSPTGDATRFGRDYLEPDVWAFELFTDCDDETSALQQLELAGGAWLADDVRSVAGKVLPLYYRIADRTRVVFGRPRKFDYTLDNRVFGGYVPITSDFKLASSFFYDGDESSVEIGMVAARGGGMRTPFRFPLHVGAAPTQNTGTFAVGGARPTPLTLTISGPVSGAYVELDGVRILETVGDIPIGPKVIVDARPWVMAATREDGASMSGILSLRTRLPRLQLTPGTHHLAFGGTDLTGQSRLKVSWRSAYPTM